MARRGLRDETGGNAVARIDCRRRSGNDLTFTLTMFTAGTLAVTAASVAIDEIRACGVRRGDGWVYSDLKTGREFDFYKPFG